MSSSWFGDPAVLPTGSATRTVSFENPSGQAGAAGAAAGGRKGAAQRTVPAGERVVLVDLDGPGRVGHIWMTVPPMPPELLRGLVLEVFYDGAEAPSVAVPAADFFGAPLGRPVPYHSALQSTQEGRGFNSWVPMPFRRHLRIELLNASPRSTTLYYQVDVALGPVGDDTGILHASFRRENPTTMRRDFVIADGFRGPGRFLGCNVGVRVSSDPGWFSWYGEGEVKMFLDGDGALPTWCGTGLEDYVGTAWGMGPHQTPLQGVPLHVADPAAPGPMPDLVSFYRWHLPDPVVFDASLRVTIQQLGAVMIPPGRDDLRTTVEEAGIVAGNGWTRLGNGPVEWFAVCERVDDYCATAYVMCRDVQPVPPVDVTAAVADVGRFAYERPSPFERALGGATSAD